MRKELNAKDLDQVVGGNCKFDADPDDMMISFGNDTKGWTKYKITLKEGETADTITSLLLGAYKMSNTSDQNDAAMIAALGNRLTLTE